MTEEKRVGAGDEAAALAIARQLIDRFEIGWFEGSEWTPVASAWEVASGMDTSLEAALRTAREEERRDTLEEAATCAEGAYPCSCDVAYTGRGLTAPDCFRCVPLAEAADAIRSLSPSPGPTRRDEPLEQEST